MFKTIVLLGIAATVVAIAGHYVIFGPKRLDKGASYKPTVRRFSLWERFIHLVTLASFAVLVISGLLGVFGTEARLYGWLWIIHYMAAPIFILGLFGLIVSWAKDGLFIPQDWDWAKCFGGYLWGPKHAPAGRFNAGQKAYLWTVGLFGLAAVISGLGRVWPLFDVTGQEILYQVHRYTSLLFVLAAIVHLYLGTICNPGTLGAMLTGKVSSDWAKSHHELWWNEMACCETKAEVKAETKNDTKNGNKKSK